MASDPEERAKRGLSWIVVTALAALVVMVLVLWLLLPLAF